MSPLPSSGRPALPLLPVCLSSFNRNGRALLRPVGAIFFPDLFFQGVQVGWPELATADDDKQSFGALGLSLSTM
jgi:hypothetical protein